MDSKEYVMPNVNHEALKVNRTNPPERDDESSSADDYDSAGDPALLSQPGSIPPESHEALRGNGRKRFIPRKYKSFDIQCKGLPGSKFSDDPSYTSDYVIGNDISKAISNRQFWITPTFCVPVVLKSKAG